MDNSDDPEIIYICANIRSPIRTLKTLLQGKTDTELNDYIVWLNNVQILEQTKTLEDLCLPRESIIQVNAQIFGASKRINIVDVVRPTKACKQYKFLHFHFLNNFHI